MRIAIFSTRSYDRDFFNAANAARHHHLVYHEARLTGETAALAKGCEVVCVFVNDDLSRAVVENLVSDGVRLAVLRCAGFNNVDLTAADELGLAVGRVPAYSPNAVAEHAFALLLTLVRHTHRAYNRVREGNFALDGLLGFDLAGKTLGVIGIGAIGSVVCRIGLGFDCRVIGCDPFPRWEMRERGVSYLSFEEVLEAADIVTLHCPLDRATHHLINAPALSRLKPGAILINTSRGAVIDTRAVIEALKGERLGGLGVDVYEEEEGLFFEDLSHGPILDDQFVRLLTFPNVLVTGHQGFFTREALTNIAATTLDNVDQFIRTGAPRHALKSVAVSG